MRPSTASLCWKKTLPPALCHAAKERERERERKRGSERGGERKRARQSERGRASEGEQTYASGREIQRGRACERAKESKGERKREIKRASISVRKGENIASTHPAPALPWHLNPSRSSTPCARPKGAHLRAPRTKPKNILFKKSS